MKRLFWFVLDSVGIGGAPDARQFGDEGSDTLGHIAEWFVKNEGRPLHLPNLQRLGLGEAYRLVHDCLPKGWGETHVEGAFAAATEISTGKDTPSGHWEMAGVPARGDWGYFPKSEECFPTSLLEELHRVGELPGSLGHCHASGTEIISRLGEESVISGKPIFYTSADSVFQITAHEEYFGLDRLYKLCELARGFLNDPLVGRVIARPFIGEPRNYERTGNRRDYSVVPPKPTVLQMVKGSGQEVVGVGKIGDIFAHTGFTKEVKAGGHPALWKTTMEQAPESGLVMTNFVEFDMLFGHRRDPLGYGLTLEEWDREMEGFLNWMSPDDLLLVTADHGNDPTWSGTDHTRERVPVMFTGPRGPSPGDYGIRGSFADMAATVAKFFGVEMDEGKMIG